MKYFLLGCILVLAFATGLFSGQKTITVALDGSGDFSNIQQSVNSVRDLFQDKDIIFIQTGIYKEKPVIPSVKTHIALVGEYQTNTTITNDDYANKSFSPHQLAEKIN